MNNHNNTPEIELHIMANPDYLAIARMAVRTVAGQLGMDEEKSEPIILAVVEALTNVIRHGYGGPCREQIIIQISRIIAGRQKKPALEIYIRDFGAQVELQHIRSRDLDDVKPGGLGVHIIESIMDENQYSHAPNKGMQLRMVKYID